MRKIGASGTLLLLIALAFYALWADVSSQLGIVVAQADVEWTMREAALFDQHLPLLDCESWGVYARDNFAHSLSADNAQNVDVFVYEVDANPIDQLGFMVIAGRAITIDDVASGRNVILLEDTVAHGLFISRDILGSGVKINDAHYTIVGIFKRITSPIRALSQLETSAAVIPMSLDDTRAKSISIWARFPQRTALLAEQRVANILNQVYGAGPAHWHIVNVGQYASLTLLMLASIIVTPMLLACAAFIKNGARLRHVRKRVLVPRLLIFMAASVLIVILFDVSACQFHTASHILTNIITAGGISNYFAALNSEKKLYFYGFFIVQRAMTLGFPLAAILIALAWFLVKSPLDSPLGT